QDHTYRTLEKALDLADRHGVDATCVELAVLGHDLFRAFEDGELLQEARARDLAIDLVEEAVPMLLHGPLAAQKLKRECGIADAEVLEAVRWHTTSCVGMGKVGLVVFLADKLDPDKVDDMPYLNSVAELARESLERATLDYLTAEITWLQGQGRLVHPASEEARNDLLLRLSLQ
ncbi:MAG: bis(5'-nucleosyl)-tetraphosphatase (symmetrical) YqeK, partial [Dehalococcoidia bacterium]